MKKKEYTARTKFDLWLEKCPLPKWHFRETEYRDYTQVNLRFRIPHKEDKKLRLENYRGLDYDA